MSSPNAAIGAESFLETRAHFDLLLATLPVAEQELFHGMVHVREEVAYRRRHFVVYKMNGRDPEVLETLSFADFDADDDQGASTMLRSDTKDRKLIIGYTPVQLWEHPVFVWLPLHCKLRWSAKPSDITKGYLGFPVIIRVQSRFNMMDRKGVMCETDVAFEKEFGFNPARG